MQSNFMSIIKRCEAAKGAGSKQIIAKALSECDFLASRLIKEALNPYRVFGVRKIEMPLTAVITTSDSAYTKFFDLLDKLHNREITGNAAIEAVRVALSNFEEEEQNYIVRVIDRDLKAGFSADTFNKTVITVGMVGKKLLDKPLVGVFENDFKIADKAYKDVGNYFFREEPFADQLIPLFDVMLADKCESTDDFEEYVTFPCQADFKYDGERTIAIVKETEVLYYSRSGKEAEHVKGLFDEELLKIRAHLNYDFILDGERCSDKGFTDTVNAKKEGNDEAKANLRFRAFFLMPLTHWLARKTDITMKETREALTAIIAATQVEKIILTEGRIVTDYQDMMNYCNDAIDLPENAARKIEGLILKNLDSVYMWDRTFAWTKVKRFFDIDARIVGFYPGRPKSRLANTVGGVNCVGFLESGERVEFNVGSGFSDAQRADMKANPDKWLAATHVIKYQEVTKSKSKEFASLRFCTYEHSRDDKLVEI
jgi:ATP-dependent DNA ligase